MSQQESDRLNLGLLLFIPYRAMESRVLRVLAEAGFGDLSVAQARVFQRIGPDGTRLTELASAAQISKQSAAFLIDQLERAGYVQRGPDPADARARLIRIAPRGSAAVLVAGGEVDRVEAEWTEHLGERATSQLRKSLTRLREFTDPYL